MSKCFCGRSDTVSWSGQAKVNAESTGTWIHGAIPLRVSNVSGQMCVFMRTVWTSDVSFTFQGFILETLNGFEGFCEISGG